MMLKPSVVMSAYRPKDWVSKRRISFRQTSMRWVALLLGCLVCFGSQYCFDTPSALQHDIQHNFIEDGYPEISENFNWLYSIYSIPNILIPLVGGMLIDRLGARVVLVATAAICVIGQGVFSFGGFKNWFWLMLVEGRAVFGVGGQTLTASQNTLLSNWFEPAQLSFVLGICISFPKLGSALNSYMSPKISHYYFGEGHQEYMNVYIPLLVGLGVMVVAFLVSLALFYMDMESDRREKRHHETQLLSHKQPSIKPPMNRIKRALSGSGISRHSRSSKSGEVKVEETEGNLLDAANEAEPGGGGHENISLKDIKRLPASFWLLIVVCMLSEALFIPFLDNGNLYFSTIYSIDSTEAGTYLVLPYVFCALLCPFLGLLVDRLKWRSLVIIFSCLMFVITYGGMMFLEYQSDVPQALIAVPLILLGICCALFCTAIVPSVPMVVNPKLFGTAFGLMEMLQNLALACFPLLASVIQHTTPDRKEGFKRQTMFYFGISVVCLIFGVVLALIDRMKGNKMMHKNFRDDYVKTVLEPEIEQLGTRRQDQEN